MMKKALPLLLVLFCFASGKPTKPVFPDTYTLIGNTWRYPLAVPPTNDRFNYYATHSDRRIDHYDGTWRDLYLKGGKRFSLQTAYDRKDCMITQGHLNAAIPDLSEYEYIRDMTIREIPCQVFQRKIVRPNNLTDTYNFYYDAVKGAPVRWEMYGMSLFIGGHRDIYLLDYGALYRNFVPAGVFDIPKECHSDAKILKPESTSPFGLRMSPNMLQKALDGSHFHLGEYEMVHTEIPRKWDWRRHGVVGPVKNQGFCGSCYSFGPVGAVESHYAIRTGELRSLSEQQVVDCSFGYESSYNWGCFGGYNSVTYDYIAEHGLVREEHYPYQPTSGLCRDNATAPTRERVSIKGYMTVPAGNRAALAEAIFLRGPVSAVFDATDNLVYHTTGVLRDATCDPYRPNHAIVVVGYDLDAQAWLIRNSWSPISNEGGYVWMGMQSHGCGVDLQASFPVL